MAKLSCFQNIPSYIVKNIVQYIITNNDPALVGQQIQVLLCICRSWRAIALSIKYAHWKVLIEDTPRFYCEFVEEATLLSKHDVQNYSHYARKVLVQFNYASIVDQSAVEKLRANKARFPGAHVLNVKIHIDGQSTLSSSEKNFSENFKQLLAYISKMLPATIQHNLFVENGLFMDTRINLDYIASLGQYILNDGGFNMIDIGYISEIPSNNMFSSFSGLSTFNCNWDENFELASQIIHANSNSLENLSIYYTCYKGFEKLFLDSSNTPVPYPYIKMLVLTKTLKLTASTMLPITNYVPFPQLECLEIGIDYPFSDDIMFRGNEKTLRRLLMNMDYKLIHILTLYGVFSKSKFKVLEDLSMLGHNQAQICIPAVKDTYSGLYSNILPYIKTLYIIPTGPAYMFVKQVTSTQNHYYLKTLSLVGCRISLLECIKILEHLPLLQTMTSTVTKLGNEFAQMTEIDVANTMRLEYKTLNSMFRVWTYPFPDNGSAQVISAAILILVSLCPSLYNIRLFKRHKSVVDHVFRNLVSPRLYADLKKTIVPAIKPTLQDSRNYSSIIIGR